MILRVTRGMLLAGILAGVSGCHVYSGSAIEGRVVDEQTGRPIQGATVAVVWDLYGGWVHGSTIGYLHAQEVLTDADGRFVLPHWGPRLVLWNELRGGAPTLIIARPDYYFHAAGHSDTRHGRPPPSFTSETRVCSCSKETFALKKFDGNWERYEENAESTLRNLPLDSSSPGFACAWTEVPRFAREIAERAEQFTKRKMLHSLPTVQRLTSQGQCGDAAQALGRLE